MLPRPKSAHLRRRLSQSGVATFRPPYAAKLPALILHHPPLNPRLSVGNRELALRRVSGSLRATGGLLAVKRLREETPLPLQQVVRTSHRLNALVAHTGPQEHVNVEMSKT